MNTKKFQLGTVLTVTTGRLLTARVVVRNAAGDFGEVDTIKIAANGNYSEVEIEIYS